MAPLVLAGAPSGLTTTRQGSCRNSLVFCGSPYPQGRSSRRTRRTISS